MHRTVCSATMVIMVLFAAVDWPLAEDIAHMGRHLGFDLLHLNVAYQNVRESLDCIKYFVQVSSDMQKKEDTELSKLGCMVVMLQDHMRNLSESYNSERSQVNQITEENKSLKEELAVSDNRTRDLRRRIDESRVYEEKLETMVQKLNDTVENRKAFSCGTHANVQHNKQKIKRLVQAFSTNSNWPTLSRGLEQSLDPSSDVYRQLKSLNYPIDHPLWTFGYKGWTQMVSLLLCAGLPVDMTDNKGQGTMLHGAVNGGHLQLVMLLLDRWADVNLANRYDITPLISAASRGYLEIVQCLVQAGANTTAQDDIGNTALISARRMGYPEVVQYLEQQGSILQ